MRTSFSKLFKILFTVVIFCYSCKKGSNNDNSASSSTGATLKSLTIQVGTYQFTAQPDNSGNISFLVPFGTCLSNGVSVAAISSSPNATSNPAKGQTLTVTSNNTALSANTWLSATMVVTSQNGANSTTYKITINDNPVYTTYNGSQTLGPGILDGTMSDTTTAMRITNVQNVPFTFELYGVSTTATKTPINGVLSLTKKDIYSLSPTGGGQSVVLVSPCSGVKYLANISHNQLYDWHDLQAMRDIFTNTDQNGGILGTDFVLMNDITMPDPGTNGLPVYGFDPVGTSSIPFRGTLNGNNHSINNFFINTSGLQNVGLFGCMETWGSNEYGVNTGVRNLTINLKAVPSGYSITGGSGNTGVFVGLYTWNSLTGALGFLNNLNVNGGSINCASGSLGGIAGSITGVSVSNCHSNTAMVLLNVNNLFNAVGGIAGATSNIVSTYSIPQTTLLVDSCSSVVNISSSANIGGIIGWAYGPVTNCSTSGTIKLSCSATNPTNVGGICGRGSAAGNASTVNISITGSTGCKVNQ